MLKIYGKIEDSIKSDSDERIKVKVIKKEKNLEYKVYKLNYLT